MTSRLRVSRSLWSCTALNWITSGRNSRDVKSRNLKRNLEKVLLRCELNSCGLNCLLDLCGRWWFAVRENVIVNCNAINYTTASFFLLWFWNFLKALQAVNKIGQNAWFAGKQPRQQLDSFPLKFSVFTTLSFSASEVSSSKQFIFDTF